MTITELSNLVGKQCDWRPVVTGACTVQAVIRDARSSYGRTDVYVEPICGKGGVCRDEVDRNLASTYQSDCRLRGCAPRPLSISYSKG